MRKEAVGISINGREVKIAHVYLEKNQLAVDFLESASLISDIDEIQQQPKSVESSETTVLEDDAFELEAEYQTEEPPKEDEAGQKNVDILYSLLRKYCARKIKVAFNIQPHRVSYQDLDTHLDYNKNAFRGSLKNKIEQWKQGFNALDNVSVITRKDGTLCNIFCDTQQPPIVNILEQINAFYKGNLFLSLMDSNEISLINLTRCSYQFMADNEVTILVQIENDFSRIIFMRGNDLLSVPPVINEKFTPDIVNIIYSKIIYELDNQNIEKITNILLSGKASTFNAKSFFEKKFSGVEVGFVVSQPLAENLSTQFSRENLAEYAIPIALAWKTVDPKNSHFIQTNLLSKHIIDRQKLLKLSFASYILLILLGISTFFFTLRITAKKIEIRSLNRKNVSLQQRIESSEKTVKLVQEKEGQVLQLNKQLSLSDSLAAGSDRLLSFLEKLNESVLSIRNIWIEELLNTKSGLVIRGTSLQRSSVPTLSRALGKGKIKKLTRNNDELSNSYFFEMEVIWDESTYKSRFRREENPNGVPLERRELDMKMATNTQKSDALNSTLNQNESLNDYLAEQDLPQNILKNQRTANRDPNQRRTGGKISRSMNQNFSMNADQNAETPQPTANIPPAVQPKSEPAPLTTQTQSNSNNTVGTTTIANGNDDFTIRISAHLIRLSAEKEATFYRSKGYTARVVELPSSQSSLRYWVCYGHFSDYDDAEKKLLKLKKIVHRDYRIVDNIANATAHRTNSGQQNNVRTANAHNSNNITPAKHTITTPVKKVSNNSNSSANNQNGQFRIRLSAHITRFTARKDVDMYRSKGYNAFLTTDRSNRNIPYWVCVGGFSSYYVADKTLKEINRVIPGDYKIVQR